MCLCPGSLSLVLLAAVGLALKAEAYIPARPTNDTSRISLSEDFIQVSHGIEGSDSLSFFRSNVSRQLYADNSTQIGNQYAARGALVHFSEGNATQAAGSAPWVAYISCDRNESDASMIDDIFTLTRDHGAVAALLYTETSEACLINQDYIDNFEKPIDVYATTKKQAARLISSPFLSADEEVYWFDSQRLNDSSSVIWEQLNNTISLKPGVEDSISSSAPPSTAEASEGASSASSTITLLEPGSGASTEDPETGLWDSASPSDVAPTATTDEGDPSNGLQRRDHLHSTPMPFHRRAPTSSDLFNGPTSFSSQGAAATTGSAYLIAVLANQNAVFASSNGSSDSDGDSNSDSGEKHGSNLTGLAMIILYAITGAVTLLFVIVILNGAIKAIRHPERYGPRARNLGYGPPQGRARGISRAILDGFPVIKFGREESQSTLPQKDQPEEVHMRDLEAATPAPQHADSEEVSAATAVPVATATKPSDQEESNVQDSEQSSQNGGARSNVDQPASTEEQHPDNPTDVNHAQTCPICVCDFEEDEELRVLPCAGRHRFHKDCIDPWLLDVSSLCPLCRWDVAQDADESGVIEEDEEQEDDVDEEGQRRRRRGTFSDRARRMLNASAASSRRISSFGQHGRSGTGETNTTGSGFSRNRFRSYLHHIRQGTASRRQNATQAAQDVAAEERSEAPPTQST